MSLVRLLTAGKSLIGLKESENRYRLTSQRLLPKFESKKNPFGAGAPGQAEAAPDQSPQAQPAVAPDVQRDSDAPVNAAPSGVSEPERLPETGGLWSRSASWCAARLRSLFVFRRALSAPASAQRQQSKRLFQAELLLQSVKVMRNDLSDSDVEIVTCKKSAAPKMKTAAAETQSQSAPGAWNKVAGTLFGGAKR